MADPAAGPAAGPARPSWGERAAVAGYRAAFAVVPRLPEVVARLAFAAGADLAWLRRGAGVRRLEEQLATATGETGRALRTRSRAGLASYARYWCDAFRLHTWTAEQLDRRTRVEGAGPLVEALASGRGAVAFLGHSGSWDQVGAWAAAHWGERGAGYGPVITAVERLEPREVFEAFLAFRARLGLQAVAVEVGGSGGGFPALVRGLRAGAFVPLLADRDLTGSGVDVELLGRASRAAAGPAALALTVRAPLFPVTVHYEPAAGRPGRPGRRRAWRTWTAVAVVHPEVLPDPALGRREQVPAMTRACVAVLEAGVRAHPEDWHALQRMFTDGGAAVGAGGAP